VSMPPLDSAPFAAGYPTALADIRDRLQIGDEINWVPDRLVDSAWLEHAPFAFWIVKAVRPKTLIELGTYSGYSYSAFCQAVQRLVLPTKCFAIDTWKGDAHSSVYSEDIFQEFSEYHDKQLKAFSSLIRAEFDEARSYFAEESVDLLHIDGFHSYEQACRDFQSWKGTLSDCGVVLFHDVNVRERDFGVWRIWQELSQEYPAFEFVHGYGLGVLGVGKDQMPLIRDLFALAKDEAATALVRSLFANCGESIRLRWEAAQFRITKQELERTNAHARAHDDLATRLEQIQAEAAQLRTARDDLASRLEQTQAEAAQLRAARDDLASKLRQARAEAAELRTARDYLASRLEHTQAEAAQLKAARDDLACRLQQAEASEHAIRNSTIWRVSAPLRHSLGEHDLLRKVARRGAKLVYWTITLQLARRLREWKAAQQSLQVHAQQIAEVRSPREPAVPVRAEQIAVHEPAFNVEELKFRPLISVVIPTYNTDEKLLRSCLDSVIGQTYPFWQLRIADDASSDPVVRQVLEEYAAKDERIRIVFRDTNGHISAATNSALSFCTGEFVAFVDHDDLLLPEALLKCVKAIDGSPQADVVYTDLAIESVDRDSRVDFRKPDWSPTFFQGVMYVGHLLVVRRVLVEELGGLDSRYDGVQDYDFMLRVSERTQNIRHVPEVLYIWRAAPGSIAAGTENKPIAGERQLQALNAHLKRIGIKASAIAHPRIPHRAVLVPSEDAKMPATTLIVEISHRERGERVLSALRAVTPRIRTELLLVTPPHEGNKWIAGIASDARVIAAGTAAGAPVAMNRAAQEANGELLMFVADGWEPVTEGWARELALYFDDDGVGVAAPLLLNQDDTVFAAGLGIGSEGTVMKLFEGHSPDGDGYFGALAATREVSAVPHACFAVRKAEFEAIGGFSRYLSRGFRSADLCVALAKRGRRTLVVPHCRFRPTDQSRADIVDPLEALTFRDKWKDDLATGDRFWRR
jgi:GT2 family glycosyltransferase